ncbi:MAG: EscU/YscU/HrcU family type III secretion system export apparatus switch protein [Solirubrobacteraceae bacterium]|nr:EscU/YscU/HrcU family type III secretion system export apparatus switch protein [Solirubrobacteraceae bacterium]
MAGEKTEAPTPKKVDEARQKGQVARSQDLTGAIVTLVGIMTVGITGPRIIELMADTMEHTLMRAATPQIVTREGIGPIVSEAGMHVVQSIWPIALACCIAAFVALVGQIGFKITPKAAMPDPKKLNPINGAKQVFGPNAAVEGIKSVLKICFVAIPALMVVVPAMPQVISMIGVGPVELGKLMIDMTMKIARNVAVAFILLGIVDFIYQKYRHTKSLKMDKQEVKDEAKNMSLPAEVKMAQKRRAMELSRARMMADVPNADVVVTNPTHFSVALKYTAGMLSPEVVAKGQDLVALRIRELAKEHGVPVIPDPPLARGLHASVDIGQAIPEDFFQAVAQVLAFVYRTRPMRSAA